MRLLTELKITIFFTHKKSAIYLNVKLPDRIINNIVHQIIT